jgi:hypothetical protein
MPTDLRHSVQSSTWAMWSTLYELTSETSCPSSYLPARCFEVDAKIN